MFGIVESLPEREDFVINGFINNSKERKRTRRYGRKPGVW
jgi:hypothetical protein